MEFTIYDFREQDGLIRGSDDTLTKIAKFLGKHKIPYIIIPSGYFKGIKLTRADYYRYLKLEKKNK